MGAKRAAMRWAAGAFALGALGWSGPALAQESGDPGAQVVEVKVGEELRADVGMARGLICDDPELVAATIENESPTRNAVSFKGLKVGTTHCRAGTADRGGPQVVFTVKVKEAERKPSSPPAEGKKDGGGDTASESL